MYRVNPAFHQVWSSKNLDGWLSIDWLIKRHISPQLNNTWQMFFTFFPTCQVRVVRFYVSCLVLLLLSSPPPLVVLLLSLSSSPPAQLRLAIHSVLCRTSTTTIHAQCSLPDLNHDHPRPVFPAGPQPRPSTPSVPCRTSTTTIHAQCSLPDLNREYPRQKICHIECQKICQIEC